MAASVSGLLLSRSHRSALVWSDFGSPVFPARAERKIRREFRDRRSRLYGGLDRWTTSGSTGVVGARPGASWKVGFLGRLFAGWGWLRRFLRIEDCDLAIRQRLADSRERFRRYPAATEMKFLELLERR